MNKVMEFLQSRVPTDDAVESSVDKDKLSKSYNKLKSIVKSIEDTENKVVQIKSKPSLKQGQIWLCKQNYYDVLGNNIKGEHPYMVLLVSGQDKLGDKTFIRIQPVTPFTDFTADDEILIEDENITGFKFIIETWNEQPVLTDLLDEFVGNLDVDILSTTETTEAKLNLSEVQKEFRKTEIRNTVYLRQSINSMLEIEEFTKGKTVFLNIDNSIHYPEIRNIEEKTIRLINEPEPTYLYAARKGKLKDRPTYLFENEIDGMEIELKIIKDKQEYIISVQKPEKIELTDYENNILKPANKNLYDGLQSGLYFIKINGIDNTIRLVLK